MKKIALILLVLLPSLVFAIETDPKSIEPFLILESKSSRIINYLQSDDDLCCIFEFSQSDTIDSNIILIRDKKTGIILGTIYGIPTKEFLKKISEQLTPEYIEDVTRKLLE